MRRTPEQAAVISSASASLTVRAAAGSGKTSVLVERYVRHVCEDGWPPDSVLTITFTRKAAAEMKGRIVRRLQELGRWAEAQQAETGPIQTVHSLCERLLRENAVEAQVSPEFEVLEGAQARLLAQESVQWALLAALEQDGPATGLVRRLSGLGAYRSAGQAHAKIVGVTLEAMDVLRSSGLERSALSCAYSDARTTLQLWKRHLWERHFGPDSAPAEEENWGPVLARLMRDAGAKVPGWVKDQSPETDIADAEDASGLVWLCTQAWEWLEMRMEAQQRFDFALLESRAVRLLEDSERTRLRLAARTRALLVDEAQDLNPVQHRLIDRIEASATMLVGDPQQSIYGFRFAERSLFVERCQSGESFSLSVNHRSVPGILNFVEVVFDTPGQAPMRAPVHDRTDCEGVELWPLPAQDSGAVTELIAEMVREGTDPKDIAVLARNSQSLQALAVTLQAKGLPYRLVGGSQRFYTRLEVRDLANALDALSDPYQDFALLALLRGPFVEVSVDGLVWAAANGPVIEAVTRSDGWSEDDQRALDRFRPWFNRLRKSVDRVPAWETLSRLYSETPFLERLASTPNGEQALANVRKLLAMAASEPETDARSFARRIRQISSLRHQEGEASVLDEDEPAITLMTIHRSKGLEFPIVVLPDTHRRLTGRRRELVADGPAGLLVTGLRTTDSAFYRWLADQEGKKARDEELRVLYVGMTRAQRRLCVVITHEAGDDTPAGVVAKRSGFPKRTLAGVRVRELSDR